MQLDQSPRKIWLLFNEDSTTIWLLIKYFTFSHRSWTVGLRVSFLFTWNAEVTIGHLHQIWCIKYLNEPIKCFYAIPFLYDWLQNSSKCGLLVASLLGTHNKYDSPVIDLTPMKAVMFSFCWNGVRVVLIQLYGHFGGCSLWCCWTVLCCNEKVFPIFSLASWV